MKQKRLLATILDQSRKEFQCGQSFSLEEVKQLLAAQSSKDVLTCQQKRERLGGECAKLDPIVEQALAEEGMETALASWAEW